VSVAALSKRTSAVARHAAKTSLGGNALCAAHSPFEFALVPCTTHAIPEIVYVQVQSELAVVDKAKEQVESFARVSFSPASEAAINEQIK
jgi:hypothetical protein